VDKKNETPNIISYKDFKQKAMLGKGGSWIDSARIETGSKLKPDGGGLLCL